MRMSGTLLGVIGLGLLFAAAGNSAFESEKEKEAKKPDPTPPTPPTPPKTPPTEERGNPPSYVPRPAGWQAWAGKVTESMLAAANATIKAYPPLGTLTPGGDIDERREWATFVEWHWHPHGQGFSAEGWHHGATLVWRFKP